MKLTIFAATGGIGRQILQQAVAAGHDVTAAVRNPAQVTADVRTVAADLAAPDQALLEAAVAGADAVLSGLGPRSLADVGIASEGTGAIVSAMQAAGARRLIVVSAAPIGTVASPARPQPPRHDPGDGVVMRTVMTPMIRRLLRGPYADLALMEDAVTGSGLDWTIVRPPRLTNRPVTGSYRTAYGSNLTRGLTISRADVAHLMLRLATLPGSIGQTVGIAY
jgi:putative NADH-flavin reductase